MNTLKFASLLCLSAFFSEPVFAERLPCGTPERISEFIDVQPSSMPPLPPSPTKGEREAHGVCSSMQVSDNFVLKWGGDAPPASTDVSLIMAALETSWQRELNEMGHEHPWGTGEYLFNVYVGDSGGCAPSAFGMGGYYTTDPDGWPMIVLSQGVFQDPVYGKSTVAHEFYHAVQHASGAYSNGGDAQWWWEATAMWVEAEVYPATQDYYVFLYGYAFQPHRQLSSYTYPSTGALEEFHQYGAAIFPRFLTEHVADWQLIRDSWTLADGFDDPVEVIRDLLDEDLDEVFADFAAHNAVWDYQHGTEMEMYLDYVSDAYGYGTMDHRIVDGVDSEGTGEEWQSAPESTLPQRYGYNVIKMNRPDDGTLVVRFDGDAQGSDGSMADWFVRVVRENESTVSYESVDIVDGKGELSISGVGDERAIYLVVSAVSFRWNSDENFGYQYQMDMGEIVEEDNGGTAPPPGPRAMGTSSTDEKSRWGCSSTSLRGSEWVLIALCGLLFRRRT
jgi:hypothetical protein